MPVLLSFILSVLASVVAYYICKWLDRDESYGILAQTVDFSEKEGEPPKVFTVQSGVRPFVHRTNALLSFCLLALYHMHSVNAIFNINQFVPTLYWQLTFQFFYDVFSVLF